MSKEVVKVKTDKVKNPDGSPMSTEFPYDFGANHDESVKLFGPATVYKLFYAKANIEVQDVARNAMIAGKTPAEAAKLAMEHKLGESTRVTKDPLKVGVDALGSMTAGERANFIKALQEKAKELNKAS